MSTWASLSGISDLWDTLCEDTVCCLSYQQTLPTASLCSFFQRSECASFPHQITRFDAPQLQESFFSKIMNHVLVPDSFFFTSEIYFWFLKSTHPNTIFSLPSITIPWLYKLCGVLNFYFHLKASFLNDWDLSVSVGENPSGLLKVFIEKGDQNTVNCKFVQVGESSSFKSMAF